MRGSVPVAEAVFLVDESLDEFFESLLCCHTREVPFL